jgi:hypothetical protein
LVLVIEEERLFPTPGTDSEKLQTSSEDFVALEVMFGARRKIQGAAAYVVHAPALHAAEVVVPFGVAIKAGLGTGQFQLLYRTQPGQQFQVPVHRAEADVGQTAADDRVQIRRRGVRIEFAQLFQDDLALECASAGI